MEKILTCIMDIGEQMLISGAEICRVESSLRRMCKAMGAKRAEVFSITSCIITTVYTEDGSSYTQTRRINTTGTDIEKIHILNQLSRKICMEKPSLEEIRKDLEAAQRCKTYPFWLERLCYALIAGSFTLFFGGGWQDALISLLIGLLASFVVYASEKIVTNKIFSKFLTSFVATLLAYIALFIGWTDAVDTIIIGNIMSLIPGIGLTTAIRDLFTGDSITGLLRTIEAVIITLAITAGYFLVAIFGGSVL